MIKKLIREKSILIELIFFCISIILLIVAFSIKMDALIKDFFINAGSGILTASVISIIYTLEKLDIVSQLTNIFDISPKFSKFGIKDILFKYVDKNMPSLENSKTIDFFACTGKGFWKGYGNDIQKAVKQNGCKVRCIITDPNNECLSSSENTKSLCPQINIANEVEESIALLKKIKNNSIGKKNSKKVKSNIEVRGYKGIPLCSIVIVDKKTLRYSGYLPFTDSSSVPIFDMVNVGNENQLFNVYSDVFEKIWNDSQEMEI